MLRYANSQHTEEHMSRSKQRYSFSRDRGAEQVSIMVSPEMNKRINSICNILEMPKASLVRFMINQGLDKVEAKLVKIHEQQEGKHLEGV